MEVVLAPDFLSAVEFPDESKHLKSKQSTISHVHNYSFKRSNVGPGQRNFTWKHSTS